MGGAGTVSVADALERVQERIQAARRRAGRTDSVTLIAVTKQVSVERIEEAYRAGVRHFGENRLQEFEAKHRFLMQHSATWHMVGHVQSNKARRAAQLFDSIDSLESLKIAQKLAAAAEAAGRTLPVLIQVDPAHEPTKFGVPPADLPDLLRQVAALPALQVEGLMAIPPSLAPPERLRPYFRGMRRLVEEMAALRIPNLTLRELSMGMSHDFEVAIEEGATQIRLGTALFGPRPRP